MEFVVMYFLLGGMLYSIKSILRALEPLRHQHPQVDMFIKSKRLLPKIIFIMIVLLLSFVMILLYPIDLMFTVYDSVTKGGKKQ